MARGKKQDTSDQTRCTATDTETGAQCLYVEHDDTIEHAYTAEQAEAAGVDTAPDGTGDTEPAETTDAGTDGPSEPEAPRRAVPAARTSVNSWWCGVCDTSSPHETAVCPKCKTPRADAPVQANA